MIIEAKNKHNKRRENDFYYITFFSVFYETTYTNVNYINNFVNYLQVHYRYSYFNALVRNKFVEMKKLVIRPSRKINDFYSVKKALKTSAHEYVNNARRFIHNA